MSADPASRPNVLVLYGLLQWPLRQWHSDHLYSFRSYARSRTFYVNVGVRRIPQALRGVEWDAVILHHTLTGQRMQPPILDFQLKRAGAVKGMAPTTVAMIQDECIFTDLMSGLINDFEADHVFSLAPESEWRKIYPSVDHDRVKFHRVLAGYLDEGTLGRVDDILAGEAATGDRPIDLGYRAWSGLLSLGRHGVLRRRLAEVFEPAAEAHGLKTDISVDMADIHHGDDWYRFLASCRYFLGAEGGATVLDSTGEFMLRTERYLDAHPNATFEEVEAACFPGEDGKLQLFAISPRHLEACATRTCQVLVEGDYSGVLKAGEHYIPIAKDLSNVEEVLDKVQSDSERERIVENAHRDIVESGRYTYRGLVEQVERESGLAALDGPRQPLTPELEKLHRATEAADKRSWRRVQASVGSARAMRKIGTTLLPSRFTDRVRDRLAGGGKGGSRGVGGI